MPNRSKEKGSRFERAIVVALNAHGLNAKRVPLSGAVQGFKGDIHFDCQGMPMPIVAECKKRANGFKTIRAMRGDADILICADDRTDPQVCMSFEYFCALASFK